MARKSTFVVSIALEVFLVRSCDALGVLLGDVLRAAMECCSEHFGAFRSARSALFGS